MYFCFNTQGLLFGHFSWTSVPVAVICSDLYWCPNQSDLPLWRVVQEIIDSNPMSDSFPLSVESLVREGSGTLTTVLFLRAELPNR